MADGHLNICKECTKKRISRYRELHPEIAKAIDRKKYLKHKEVYRDRAAAYNRKWKRKIGHIHNHISRAIAAGKIKRPSNCESCGKRCKTNGHHESYAKDDALRVKWLCTECHMRLHHKNTHKKNSDADPSVGA